MGGINNAGNEKDPFSIFLLSSLQLNQRKLFPETVSTPPAPPPTDSRNKPLTAQTEYKIKLTDNDALFKQNVGFACQKDM